MQTLRLIVPLMSASVSSEPRLSRVLTRVFSAARVFFHITRRGLESI